MIFALTFMALQLTYCTVKLRALTLTLAVLQKILVPRAEAQDEDSPVQLTFTIKPDATNHQETFNISFTSGMRESWSYMALILLFFLGLSILIKYVRKIFCQIHPHLITNLVFQFSGLRGTIAIPIKTFTNLPTDLRLSFTETLMNFQIQKYFPPILSFCWDASVLDVITEATVKLPNSVNLTLLSAWQLRGIFADNFEIQILGRRKLFQCGS